MALHNFYSNYYNNDEIKKIFHYFAESRIIVYIANTKTFSNKDLDNSEYFYKLTIRELENIFKQ